MRVCRVVGSVTPAKAVDRLEGASYLVVEPASTAGIRGGSPFVAVDAVQAGIGDLVIV